ncbi:pilus assembly protein [Undibacterium luofuense]|uniref:PilY1 beta-propeller domain-containing protein n=1 Tax=Undibacterium luofuense TaxID=2828733 RepID=A0A941DK90_9BURK|nr:PilC/PilY family type IV pilus protein [Undibacterium luofuense]MBR7781144.1 hypothetical protein [Undibacterium luofuense]
MKKSVYLLSFSLVTQLVHSQLVFAATPLTVPQAPLSTAAISQVKPNLMFILDSSGSMGEKYLPDWAGWVYCSYQLDGTVYFGQDCRQLPPYFSGDFNAVYYNPEIRYQPPMDSSGVEYPSITSYNSVRQNGFDTNSAATNLLTDLDDFVWCDDNNPNNCLRNNNFVLPATIGGKRYATQSAVKATGTSKFVSGTPANPVISASSAVGPYYYRINPGEYCADDALTDCILSSGPSAAYPYPARVRWCDSETNAKTAIPPVGACRATQSATFYNVRYLTGQFNSGAPAAGASAASVTIPLALSNCSGSDQTGVDRIEVDGVGNILKAATRLRKNAANLISDIISGGASSGYSFSKDSAGNLVIAAPLTLTRDTSVKLVKSAASTGNCGVTPDQVVLSGYRAARAAIPAGNYGNFSRTDIVPGKTYPRYPGRSDCISSTTSCSYTEEMTNFANWFTYYQSRMQTMKTVVSRSFKPIDNRFRVGFIDIYGQNYLAPKVFNSGTGSQKEAWYSQLFGVTPGGATPLRSALARVGRIFAGKGPAGTGDPVEYSCQQNFALLTTDGFWNTDKEADVQNISGGQIGNQDGGVTARPKYEGPVASTNSLADVAKYYYETDIRNSSFNNCTGALGNDVCTDNVFTSAKDPNNKQHMTTYTLGLGVDGELRYRPDYASAGTGDFAKIKNGLLNWPEPVSNTNSAVDDLWHAAVNGGGSYFSAKDPAQLTRSLTASLNEISAKTASGGGAGTSSLNPVGGNNYAYISSYTSVKWQGNIERRTIDTMTGQISKAAGRCVENVVPGNCPLPGAVQQFVENDSVIYRCVTPGLPDVELPVGCTGSMNNKVRPDSDTRNIYIAGAGNTLLPFTATGLQTAGKNSSFFSAANLSQYSNLDPVTQQPAVSLTNLVNYLRGQSQYEDKLSNPQLNRLFRAREAILGDITESQLAYVGKPTFSYIDAGYDAFKTAQASRTPMIYVGANDGMLHAFDADSLEEKWAFIPSAVLGNLWKLADINYGGNHQNFVNGSPVIADVYDGTTWKTILVAGLNGGGRGYFAMDITNPLSPSLLWEFGATNDNDIGYSFSPPVVTKTASGQWVVLLSSGYNNGNPGSGNGCVIALNASSGAVSKKICNGSGSAVAPSGLGPLAAWADSPQTNNVTELVYAGDLNGDVWKFNLTTEAVSHLATLKDKNGNRQPVTTEPALGNVRNAKVIFVGTGKYLELADISNRSAQSLYALKDDPALDSPAGVSARTKLVQKTITQSGSTRTINSSNVDYSTDLGWYLDWPDSGERITLSPKLDMGTLIVPSNVPSDEACSPGGYGWLNLLDYASGNNKFTTSGGVLAGKMYSSQIVGYNVVYTKNGKRVISIIKENDPNPEKASEDDAGTQRFIGKRIVWRELVPDLVMPKP